MLAEFGAPLGEDGRIVVTPRLEVNGCDGLYAIGDAAQIVEDGNPWPTMRRAIEAIWQGALLARRIAGHYPAGAGPSHRLRTDFWYGLSLGAKKSAIVRGGRLDERSAVCRARRGLQWAYYRRFPVR